MALNLYRFSYANISQEEFQTLSEKIDAWSYNGLTRNRDEKTAEFLFDEKESPDIFNIPDCCHLTKIL